MISSVSPVRVDMNGIELLTKFLLPLPEKHKGLTDTEQPYRQRYVDLITNEHSRDVFRTRSKIIQGIGDYFLKQSFMQVETPMLQVIPSGATAHPFVFHHNALDIDMYLHVTPELYLKRVVVGGFEYLKLMGTSLMRACPHAVTQNSP